MLMKCIVEDLGRSRRRPTAEEKEHIAHHIAEAAEALSGKLPPNPYDGNVDIRKAAQMIGIAPGTLRNWISRGQFTAEHGLTRIGRGRGRLKVSRHGLLRAMQRGALHTEGNKGGPSPKEAYGIRTGTQGQT